MLKWFGLLLLVGLFVALATAASAQPRPVAQWADWSSYGTAFANPSSAALDAWNTPRRGCAVARLALSEGIGNGITLWAKRSYASPRPCLGCAADGFPSGHTMNSAIGSAHAWRAGWARWTLAPAFVIATGVLRHEANRHTWRQITAGALLGVGAEAAGQLIHCE